MEHQKTNSNLQSQHDDWGEVHNQLIDVQRQKKIQKKSLTISNPGDADEKEADDVAHKVSHGESAEIHGTGSSVNRKGEGSAETTPEFQVKLERSKGAGSPLPENVQGEMGSKMGADFSGVKVHTGASSYAMNQEVSAKAFTHGNDVYFSEGAYNPSSSEGKELLAHELAHTIQQGDVLRRQVSPQGVWEKDKRDDGSEITYKSEEEANLRKQQIESTGEWEQVKVVSITIKGETQWHIESRGTRTIKNFIKLLRKFEAAYPKWTKTGMLGALRRLELADTQNFQIMYGTKPAADIVPVPDKLTNEDINQMKQMIMHGGKGAKEFGLAKDEFGQYIGLGHVLTGIEAGLHRKKDVDVGGLGSINVGETVDNLYATTIGGDLGQSATMKTLGQQTAYIGENTEATDAELIGDIDGFLLGKDILNPKTEIGKQWASCTYLSDFLEWYYTSDLRKKRFSNATTGIPTSELEDQTTRFSTNYNYSKVGMAGAAMDTSKQSKEAVADYEAWLKKQTAKTFDDPKAFTIGTTTANNVLLVRDPGQYEQTIIAHLPSATTLKLIDEGSSQSFNQVLDEFKWVRVMVLDGSYEGNVGWISKRFFQTN